MHVEDAEQDALVLALVLAMRLAAVALVLAAGLLAGPVSAASLGQKSAFALVEMPVPQLGAEEVEVREQLVGVRLQLDGLLVEFEKDGNHQDPERIALLAEKFSQLGRLYYLYELLNLSDLALSNALVLVPEVSEWRYLRAVVRSLNGSPEQALEEFEVVLESQPRDVATLVRTADLLFDLSRYQEAERLYARAQDASPSEAAAVAGLGQVALRLGQHQRAVDLLTHALELQPSADSLHYPLALSLRALGEVDAARQALKANKGGSVILEDPMIDGLSAESRSSLALFHAGNLAMRRGDMSTAEGFFRRFILLRSDHVVATHNLGLVLLAQQKRAAGLQALQKAVVMDPEFRGGHYFLAAALVEDGRFEEALEHYRKAHAIDPMERSIHADYATLLARLGDVQAALASLRPVVDGDPDAHYVRLKYATILATAGRSVEAKPLLLRLTEGEMEASLRAEALYHLAILRLNEDDTEGARKLLEQSLVLGDASGPANAAMAQLLARSGDLEGAVKKFSRALEAQPYDDRSQFGHAMGLLLLDRDADALAALETAVRLLPEHRALRHVLARLLAASSEESVRDGARAVQMAQELVDEQLNLEHAETLAMALAEVGRFEEALVWQRRVVQQARTISGGAVDSSGAQQVRVARIALFERRSAVRDPWEP